MKTALELEFGIRLELARLRFPKIPRKKEVEEYSRVKRAWEDILRYVHEHSNYDAAKILEDYMKESDNMIFAASPKAKPYFMEAHDLADYIYDLLF